MKLYHIFMSSPDVLGNLVTMAIIVTLPSFQYLSREHLPLLPLLLLSFPLHAGDLHSASIPNLFFDFLFDARANLSLLMLTISPPHFYFVGW